MVNFTNIISAEWWCKWWAWWIIHRNKQKAILKHIQM